jgi:hypothetical protein
MDNPRFKPFFVHHNTPSLKGLSAKQRSAPRGFTAYIQPGNDPRTVYMQVAFCSSKDNFCKGIGRWQADKAPIKTINTRKVVEELMNCSEKTTRWSFDFEYLFKYMV